VPDRPALAIKIGNDPGALPQSGLDHADIVFEEPIEGAITRLLSVFECTGDPKVGPIRSTRWIDTQILPMFDHPAFAFAGGIAPDLRAVHQTPVDDLDFTRYYSDYFRTDTRAAPENLYASTTTMWGLDHSRSAPRPVFSYGSTVPTGTPERSVTLTYSGIFALSWHWSGQKSRWIRYVNYGESGFVPDTDADGSPVDAANVVILRVATHPGPYVEDQEGAYGVRSQTVGEGDALVLRNGVAIRARWQRAAVSDPISLTSSGTGAPIKLAPGNTWVELLPLHAGLSEQGATAAG